LSVVADQFGGPTFAGDVAKTLIKIVSQIEVNANCCWGVYHYSGSPHVSWFQFAETIFREAQEQGIMECSPVLSAIETSCYPTAAKRSANSALDCGKINQVFGIKQSDWVGALLRIKHYI
jgi:dTDP-4-dehydrorhamnose reductase